MDIQAYLKEVISHIRSKEARKFVQLELEHHMQAVKEEGIKRGESVEKAEQMAITQMGDSAQLGQKMNKLHKPKMDWLMFSGFVVLIVLSFLPLIYLQQTDFVMRKTVYSVIGFVLVFICMFFDYRKLIKYGYWFYGIGIVLLIILNMSPYIINGRPYLILASFTIEASSTLPLFLLGWASILSHFKKSTLNKVIVEAPDSNKRSALNLSQGWWKLALLYTLSVLLLFPSANLFLILLYTALVVVMVLFSPVMKRDKYIFSGGIGLLAVIGSVMVVFTKPYIFDRFRAFLQPEEYATTYGYLIMKAKEYIGNAGWFGQALPKNGFEMAEAHTDFIFVTMTYGYGWLLAGIMVILLVGLSIRMILNFKTLQDSFGRMLTIGAVTLYTLSFSWSVLMSFGILPFVGVSLPFFSYGLMPTVLHSFLIGMVLSVYRRKDFVSFSMK